jgi:formiminotetrahydrofolate cyclodeaminase
MSEPYLGRPLEAFLDDAAAGRPTPGGGAVAALVGALASAMASMAANFTVGKKRFAAVEADVRAALEALDACRRRLCELIEADIAGYAAVGAAYGMPKSDAAERAAREQAIQAALRRAMAAPAQTADRCLEVLGVCASLAGTCNPNLLSDVGVAAILAEAALRAAQINVRVNLAALTDAALVAGQREKLAEGAGRARALGAQVAAAIDRKM